MVVDIRYHLASIVAVFLALGLGILVGMALAGGGEGVTRQEEWLASLERELALMQDRRGHTAALLQEVQLERDVYARFVEAAGRVLLADALAGEQAAVVVVGEERTALEAVQHLLEEAGARVVRLAHVDPQRIGSTGSASSTEDAMFSDGKGGSAGALLAAAMIGTGDEPVADVQTPSLWLRTASTVPATVLIFVVGAPEEEMLSFVRDALDALEGTDVSTAILATDPDEKWRRIADERDIAYVAHWPNPLGRLSVVHLLARRETGVFGMGEAMAAWPPGLLAPREREADEP